MRLYCSESRMRPVFSVRSFHTSVWKGGAYSLDRQICDPVSLRRRKVWQWSLAGTFLLGILAGLLLFLSEEDSPISLMYRAPNAPGSIVRLLSISILPFLISAAVVSLGRPRLLLPICFVKAFLFAFSYCAVLRAYGSAGWLVQSLLLFGDEAVLPVLYWFWLRHPPGGRSASLGEVLVILCGILLIGSVNKSIISPLLAGLIEF